MQPGVSAAPGISGPVLIDWGVRKTLEHTEARFAQSRVMHHGHPELAG